MNNKDMPAYPNDEPPGMWEVSDLYGGEADCAEDLKALDRFRNCTPALCALTKLEAFTKAAMQSLLVGVRPTVSRIELELIASKSVEAAEAALAELERRNEI